MLGQKAYKNHFFITQLLIALFLISSCFIFTNTSAQVKQNPIDTLQAANVIDSNLKINNSDSILSKDSLKKVQQQAQAGIPISKDALEDVVIATAKDSAIMDLKTNNFYLYGEAKVDYDGRKINADAITFNQSNNIATATRVPDSTKPNKEIPTFVQGKETVRYNQLQYNFKTQRAIIQHARSQYGEGFVLSEQIKRNSDQSLYGYKNTYTTCALEHPHFGIRARKIKIIPNQAIAMGSANIEIEGVPTPLFLPFGFFPTNNQTRKSGFILPGYTVEANRGLGFLKGGYYLHINDYVDLEARADIFTKGSFVGYLTSNYVKKYKYNGQLFFSYGLNKTGAEFDPNATINKSFKINWTHTMNTKARPGTNFNAKVDIQGGNFNALNSFNSFAILQNQFMSNITYSKVWEGKPYSLTIGLTHSQNTSTKLVEIGLPNATFYINARTPFQRKNPVGSPKWFEKITIGYSASAINNLKFYDTAFSLNNLQLTDFRNGIRHNIPISANYSIFRFITATFNAGYNEYWNSMQTHRGYNDISKKVDTSYDYNFFSSRDFNGSFTLNTQIYGMKLFKKGSIKGVRHVIRPSLGVSYRPDFALKPFNYYYTTRLDSTYLLSTLSPYEQSVIGMPPNGKSGLVNFGLNNNLQMKVRNKKDTATGFKNIVLLDALDFNTSYNLAADSFKWDMFRFSARSNIANILNITANANFDPYAWDYDKNRRSQQTMNESGKGLARLTTATLGFGTSFRSKRKSDKSNNSATQTEDYKSLMRNNGYQQYVDFNIPWSLNLTYSFNLTRQVSSYSKRDTNLISQTISFNGDFNLTDRWKVSFNSGYNLVEKKMTFTSIDIHRDLHCWEMRLGLMPFGDRKSFNFTLNVKAQVLQDLKLTRRRDFRDAIN
jgi:lipopolysaccharide assembly outer membrane protein LptD (OstA)